MINHIVLIRWREGISPTEIGNVVAAAWELRKISGVLDVGVYRNLGVAQAQYGKGIGHVFMIRLRDLQALEEFRPHPIHRDYGQTFFPSAAEVTIVDIEDQ
jgi:hypothetical protein